MVLDRVAEEIIKPQYVETCPSGQSTSKALSDNTDVHTMGREIVLQELGVDEQWTEYVCKVQQHFLRPRGACGGVRDVGLNPRYRLDPPHRLAGVFDPLRAVVRYWAGDDWGCGGHFRAEYTMSQKICRLLGVDAKTKGIL